MLVDEITEVVFGSYAVGVVKDVGDYDIFAQLRLRKHKADELILVDSIEVDSSDRCASGTIQNVGDLAQLFEGHFPGQPILPGALTLEALAEVAHRHLLETEPFGSGAFLKRIDGWRFRQVIVPGNAVDLRAEEQDVGVMMVKAIVNGKTAAEGKLTFVPGSRTAFPLPGQATLPGALLVEAMAEVGAVAVLGMEENIGKIAFLASADDWQFYLPVVAGRELRLKASLRELRRSFGKGHFVALSDEGLVAEGNLVFGLGARSAMEETTLVCT